MHQPIDNTASFNITDGLIGPSARNKRDLGFKKLWQRKGESRSANQKSRDENVLETDDSAECTSRKSEEDVENVTIKLYQISKKLGLTPEALLSQLESGEDIGIPLGGNH